jgi:hypothetical protein
MTNSPGEFLHVRFCEDSGFHAYQMLEAGIRQFTVWATPRRTDTSLLRLPGILRPIHRRTCGVTDG